MKSNSKNSLVFAELMCGLPCDTIETEPIDSLQDESLFLISMTNPWYVDLILYLHTQPFHTNLS